MANEKILTGVKKIHITPWTASDNGLDLASANGLDLDNVIADTVTITQDDPETNSIDCETRDEPIIEATTLGKYTFTMDSADINFDILTKALGFTKVGNDIAYAPSSYVKKYVMLEVVMQGAKFVIPRAQLSSKIDASSLKTNVAKGTISGTAYNAKIKAGSGTGNEFETPFFVAGSGWGAAAANAANKFKVSKITA